MKQLIAIDVQMVDVLDWAAFSAALPPDVVVLWLQPERDGLLQLREALGALGQVGAVHLVSHGAPGAIALGSSWLDQASLATHASDLAAIGAGLAPGADILLYGCHVAQGAEGQAFVLALAEATGADVAASDDLTGLAALGGDAVLEFSSGAIQAAVLPLAALHGVLGRFGGDDGQNAMAGGAGDDLLLAYGGDDSLSASAGNDVLVGGAGSDTASYSGKLSDHHLSQTPSGALQVVKPEGTDALMGIETLVFADATVNITTGPRAAEFRVNSVTQNKQEHVSTSALLDGGWVATWVSLGQDGSGAGVYGQRYSATGALVGAEFRVNTTTLLGQQAPSVAGLADGGWVVGWQSLDAASFGWSIQTQRYAADGMPMGTETQVSGAQASAQPAVAALPAGGWVVGWSAYDPDNNAYGLYTRPYSASGVAGSPVRVGPEASGDPWSPAVAGLQGGWVVAWTQAGAKGFDVHVRLVAQTSTGTALKADTVLQTQASDTAFQPGITVLQDGTWLVSWESSGGAGRHIRAQHFNAAGDKLGNELQIATGSSHSELHTAVTGLLDGGWLIAWQTTGLDGAGLGIQAQRYSAAGTTIGEAFQVNTYSTDQQMRPSASGLSDGGWVIGWQSWGQDGDSEGIYAQRYDASGEALRAGMSLNITGNASAQHLIGTAGDDTLSGAGGNDTLSGGDGQDTAIYPGILSDYTHTRSATGALQLVKPDGTDVLTGIETLQFADARMAFGAGSVAHPTRVNGPSAGNYAQTTQSELPDGGWLTLWVSAGEIKAQRYASEGSPLGAELSLGAGNSPAIATLKGGGWVVAWVGENNVQLARYAADGQAIGSLTSVQFVREGMFAGPSNVNADASLAALSDGGWVLTWSTWGELFQEFTVAQRFTADGRRIGEQFSVTHPEEQSSHPSVAGLSEGGWVHIWNQYADNKFTIYQRQFDALGQPKTTTALAVSPEDYPLSALATADGGWLSFWRNETDQISGHATLHTQRFSSAGTASTEPTALQTDLYASSLLGELCLLADQGWLVVWSGAADGEYSPVIRGQRYAADASPAGDPFVLIDDSAPKRDLSVTAMADGGWVLNWSTKAPAGDGSDVYSQRFDAQGLPSTPGMNAHIEGDDSPQALRGGAGADTLLGAGGDDTLQGGAGDDLIQGGTGQDLAVFEGQRSDYSLGVSPSGTLSVSGPHGTDTLSGIERLEFLNDGQYRLQPSAAAWEFKVNTTTLGHQGDPSMAVLADGGWVLSWTHSPPDPTDWRDPPLPSSVYFQRYDAHGNTVGQETLAGNALGSFQSEAAVTALADGGWVVAWSAKSGVYAFDSAVYARVFSASGAGGSDIPIHGSGFTESGSTAITALKDGGWLATWSNSASPVGPGIFGQRYSAEGQALGDAFKVSEDTLVKPQTAGLADGGWLVTWTHWAADGNAEVAARRYLASGEAAGDAFQVNTHTDGFQGYPVVAGLDGGGWLVAWQSNGQDQGPDGASTGIYAQRYRADGTAVGSEFRANTHLVNEQSSPALTQLADGGWLITWQSVAQDHADGWYGVYGQRFAADGTPVGEEFRANTHAPNNQMEPAVAALPEGGWVVSWMSEGQDGSAGGVYAQVFDASGAAVKRDMELTRLTVLSPTLNQVNTLQGATEDTPFTITWQALADAADEQMPEGDVLFFRVEAISSGSLTLNGIAVTAGAAVIGAGQAAVWTPAAGANGTLPAFEVSAFNGERASLPAQVQVAVTAVDDAPSSADALLEMQEDQPRVLRLEDFSYSDQDGDALALLHFRMATSDALALQFQVAGEWVTQAAGDHSITPADVAVGLVRLLPTANFNGALDTALGFDLADASGQWSGQAPPTSLDYLPTYKLAVDVAAVNDAPTLSVPPAQQANGKQAMVLSSANGNALSVGDVDLGEAGSDTLQVTLRVSDGKGTLALNNPAGLEGEVGAVPKDSLLFWGTVPAINAALAAGLTLSPGVAGIDVSVSDGTAAATATVTIEGAMVMGQYIQGDGSGGGGGGQSGLNDGAAGGDGGGDNDTLTGSAGDDILFGDGSGGGGGGTQAMLDKAPGAGGAGGSGADHLQGGKGNDILFGDGFDGLAGSTRGGAGGLGGGGGGGGAGGVGVPFEGQGGIGGLAAGRGNSGSPYLPAPLAPLVEGMDSTNSLPDSVGQLGTGGWTPEYFAGGGGGGGFGGAAGGNGGYLSWNANQAGANGDKAPHTYSDDNGNLAAYLSQPSVLRSLLTQYPKHGHGNDTLDGGAGSDQLFGLGGADTFVFDLATAQAGDTDRVWDFSAEDRLLLLDTEPVPLDALQRMVAQATAVDADGDGQQDDLRLSHGSGDRLMQIELINTQYVHVDVASASVMKGQPKHLPTGSVTVAGNATQGESLTASNTLENIDGLGDISYQWLASGTPITGATGSTLVLSQAHVGKAISVLASYTDGFGQAQSVSSDATAAVSNTNDAPRFWLGSGKITTSIGTSGEVGRSMALQPDGNILLAGEASFINGKGDSDFALIRYQSDGSLDSNFGLNGKLTTAIGFADSAKTVTVQTDGRILLTGATFINGNVDFALTRYLADGRLDTSFGTGGRVVDAIGLYTDEVFSTIVQPNGKILVAGSTFTGMRDAFALVRYNINGSRDTSFGVNGKSITEFELTSSAARSITIQADGKILLAGYQIVGQNNDSNFAVIRYKDNGSLDTEFGANGMVSTPIGYGASVFVQADGKILVAGSDGHFALVRYNANGSVDTGFGSEGKVTTEIGAISSRAYGITLQPDGKILVAGSSYNGANASGAPDFDFALARYDATGSLDASFGNGGVVTTDFGSRFDEAFSIAVQPDGKILLGGYATTNTGGFALARYNANGTLDKSFGSAPSLPMIYQEGGNPISIGISGSLVDEDLEESHYGGSSLTLSREGGANIDDNFSSSGRLSALTEGAGLSLGMATIGMVTQNSAGILRLDFNSNVTQELLDEVLKGISYSNTSNAPPSTVDINWLFSDGNTGDQGAGGALSATRKVEVNITAMNDAPVLTPAAPTLPSITEDETTHTGQSVASILGNSLTDVDASAAQGLAIFALSGSNGKWQYSLNLGGGWTDVGAVDNNTALLLRSSDLVRWLPDGNNADTATFSYHGWDQSSGTAGTKVSAASRGKTSALSEASDRASLSIQPVNDLPTGSVTYSGTASPGQTLTAANTLGDPDGLGTIGYQWLANGAAIRGATSDTLLITPDQAGQQISVRASYTDQQGSAESVDSASVQVNTPPVARNNAYTIPEDAILVLGNLISDGWTPGTTGQTWFHDTDADGDTLVISAVTVGDVLTAWADLPNSSDPADLVDAARGHVWKAIALPHGSAWLQADGTLRFTGQASDALGYTISDGQGGTASAQVDIHVLAAPAKLSITHWKAGKGALAGVDLGTAQNGQAIKTDADGRANVRGLGNPDGEGAGQTLLQPTLEVSRSQAGINLTDVLGALKVYLGKPLPDAYNSDLKYIAADFDGNGSVNLSDVLGLLKFYLGKPVNAAPTWVFVDSAQTTDVGGQALHLSSQAGQALSTSHAAPAPIQADLNSGVPLQLVGVLRGDVDGSWVG